jgi:thiol-disulfide isomerase/thioredoxin
MFLVGKGIPEHIRSLPQTFLNTPFGQMMKPQLDMALRGVTQGEGGQDVPAPTRPAAPSVSQTRIPQGAVSRPVKGYVRNVSNLRELEELLALTSNSCAVIFFTSSNCAPCKIVYPTYDELAEEAGDKAVLIKVDLNFAYDVGAKYNVRATPTFMTFLKGRKENEWSGANPAQLKGNVRMLIQMAFPPHPHGGLRLPSLQRKITSYVTYTKIPPMDKLLHKLGTYGAEPTIQSVVDFIKKRNLTTPAETAVPDLSSLAAYLRSTYPTMPIDMHFAVIDLVRVAFLDPRVSGFFAEEPNHKTLLTLFSHSTDLAACPYNLRIVMLQLACNLFTTPLYPDQIASNQSLRETCIRLLTGCLLDNHTNLRVVAASFAYNLAVYNHNERFEGRPDKLLEEDQVELVASLLEAIGSEQESIEALHGCLFALGLFLYEAPMDGSVVDLCRAMGIAETVKEKSQVPVLKSEPLLKEVGQELLGKGLK